MSYFHNGMMFSESCLVGFCPPTKQSGAIAAMLYNATRYPCNPVTPIYQCNRPSAGSCLADYPSSISSSHDLLDASVNPQELSLDHASAGELAMDKPFASHRMANNVEELMMKPAGWRGEFLRATLSSAGMGFSQRHLDMALYGYTTSPVQEKRTSRPGYALSGIKSSELSYGIDRLLGNDVTAEPTKPINETLSDSKNLNLPDGLGLYRTDVGGVLHCGVICLKPLIPRSTRFGPFRGRLVDPAEVKGHGDNNLFWEVFSHGVLSHFIDGSNCHWMTYVNCARTSDEQNLIVVQLKGKIYYEACKDIHQGTELLIWYGDAYLKFMGIPVTLKPTLEGEELSNQDANEGYQCQRCGKVFAYQYYREKHLKYTRCVDQGDRKFPCHLCTRSFEKRDRLRIHILHVHEKHRPHKCTMCSKSFSQSSSLNKHMRVHSGERPYKCAYCSKAFTASSILRTHVRQHSGEKPFKCKYCGKAFASHAAHDSHVKRTHNSDNACAICGRSFQDVYHQRLHTCLRTSSVSVKKTVGAETIDQLPSAAPSNATCEDTSSSPLATFVHAVTSKSTRYRRSDEGLNFEDEIDVVGLNLAQEISP